MEYEVDRMTTFNGAAFRALTLGNATLQSRLLTLFLREVDDLRAAVEAGCREGSESFQETIHRLKSASHFLAAEHLRLLLDRAGNLGDTRVEVNRQSATRLIVDELTRLEGVLREECALLGATARRCPPLHRDGANAN